MDNIVSLLKSIENETDSIIRVAVVGGIDIIAEEMKAQINALPIDHGRGTENHKLAGVTNTQKRGLLEGLGTTPIETVGGMTYQKIGFGGYNENGQANQMIARWVESGTSHQTKVAFVRKALNRSKQRAQERAEELARKKVKEIQERT